ncbi:MAG TPA: 3'-5' exonuclease [Spirochaetota bacterium]|nr:3'-5' exonuclease [Spirochaetota bacterium]
MKGSVINGGIEKDKQNNEYLVINGVLENRQPFRWEISKPAYTAFIKSDCAADLSGQTVFKNRFRSLKNEKLDAVIFKSHELLKQTVKKLPDNTVYEHDLDPITNFLICNKIKGSIAFSCPPAVNPNGVAVFKDPPFRPAAGLVPYQYLSFDLETEALKNKKYGRLYSISLYSKDTAKVLMLDTTRKNDSYIEYYPSESDLIRAFINEVNRINPQFFIGWNVLNFDFDFLLAKCAQLNIAFNIGCGKTPAHHFRGGNNNKDLYMRIPGRVVIDGIPLLKEMGFRLKNYSLDNVSHELLGENKLITAKNEDKIKEINRQFKEEKKKLAQYNLKDSELVYRLFRKYHIFDYIKAKISLSGLIPERSYSPLDLLDAFYIPALHKKKYAAPNRKKNTAKHFSGLTNFSSFTEQFTNIAAFSFPWFNYSVLKTFKTDPLGRIKADDDPDNSLSTPSGITFHPKKNILNAIFRKFDDKIKNFSDRKKHGHITTLKTLANTLTSAVLSPYSRFAVPGIISSVKNNSQEIIKITQNLLRKMGYTTVYSHKNKLFVKLPDEAADIRKAIEVASFLNVKLTKYIKDHFQVENHLKLQADKFYHSFFLGPRALENTGFTDNYCGYYTDHSGKKTFFNGFNLRSGDWTLLANDFLEELLKNILQNRSQEQTITAYKDKLKKPAVSSACTYYKKITKKLSEYEAPFPPHIQAARMLRHKPEKYIKFLYTKNGVEPYQPHKEQIPDTAHYLHKQLLPVARMVLEPLGQKETLEKLADSSPQLSFF